MTGVEMKDNFLLSYDINGNIGVGFTDDEIIDFLNNALTEYFDMLVKVFEIDEKVRESLIPYTGRDKISDIVVGVPMEIGYSSLFYDMTSFVAKGYIIVNEQLEDINQKYIPVKPITNDYYNANINNKYKKPYKNLAWRMGIGYNGKQFNEIICFDKSLIDFYVYTFVVVPLKIYNSVDSKLLLSEIDCKNIVKLAVQQAMIATGAARGNSQ